MIIKIYFDETGLSKGTAFDSRITEANPEEGIYDISPSPNNVYFREQDGTVRHATDEEVLSTLPYDVKRKKGYPPIGDQLDAIWKLINNPEDVDGKAIKDAVAQVKTKYPK